MSKRFVTIWFRHLRTDWFSRRQPSLRDKPFVLASPDHGRMIITSVNSAAQVQEIHSGMAVADARAILPSLHVIDDRPELSDKLLKRLAEWCIRYAPGAAVALPDGLILDATGCAHLWGGEKYYLTQISKRLSGLGFDIRIAMADTIGAAWAITRFGQELQILNSGEQMTALLSLSPEALRLEPETIERLNKLGLRQIKSFISIPRSALRRRFGSHLIQRINQALGKEEEIIYPVQPIEPYQERLPCIEPIVTLTGIEIALQRLLETLCNRLQNEGKGLRMVRFLCYRVDGKIEQIEIGTNRPTHHRQHLFKLFELKLSSIEPALGIELFRIEALKTEEISPLQEKLWEGVCGLEDVKFSELIDRFTNKIGEQAIHRYLPAEHHWPEKSIQEASCIQEPLTTNWRSDKPRPVLLLSNPEKIEVTVPIPDYPPMLFLYKGKMHKITKADGPERIEREWWLEEGLHRDYYSVEDEEGHRYWVFRSGHYTENNKPQWFIHGFFA